MDFGELSPNGRGAMGWLKEQLREQLTTSLADA